VHPGHQVTCPKEEEEEDGQEDMMIMVMTIIVIFINRSRIQGEGLIFILGEKGAVVVFAFMLEATEILKGLGCKDVSNKHYLTNRPQMLCLNFSKRQLYRVEIKFTLKQATKAQRGSRGIVILFL
jgi:hypothetical protein